MVTPTRLSEALGRQHAIAALLALYHEPKTLGATELTERIQGYAGSGIAIAKHRQKHGLMEIKETPGVAGKRAYRITLTPLGKRIAQFLEAAAKIMPP